MNIKKYILLFLFFAWLSAIYAQSIVVVTGSQVRLRRHPSTSGAIYTDSKSGKTVYAQIGDSFPLLKELKDWYGIRYSNGETLYVSRQFSQREDHTLQREEAVLGGDVQQQQASVIEQHNIDERLDDKANTSVLPAGQYAWSGRQGQYIGFELDITIDADRRVSGQIYYPESRNKNKVFHAQEQWAIAGTVTDNEDRTSILTLQEKTKEGENTLILTLEQGCKVRGGYWTNGSQRFELNNMLLSQESL